MTRIWGHVCCWTPGVKVAPRLGPNWRPCSVRCLCNSTLKGMVVPPWPSPSSAPAAAELGLSKQLASGVVSRGRASIFHEAALGSIQKRG